MNDKYYNITLALAGMIQATSLAKEFAETGRLDEQAYETSVYSIFQTSPKCIAEIYGGIDKLKLGLRALVELFNPAAISSRAHTRYLVSLIQMQKKITHHPSANGQLIQRISQIKKQVDYFSLTHPTVISNLADAYVNAVSSFNFRIFFQGSRHILNSEQNLEKIRALLLAGIRSTVLWRQVGGSRWQFLLSRAAIKEEAKRILINC